MKVLKKFLLCFFVGGLFTLFPGLVEAAEQDYEAGFIFYDYDYEAYPRPNRWYNLEFYDGYAQEITDLTTLKSGDYIAVATTLKVIGDASGVAFQMYYSYDENYFEPLATDPTAVFDERTVEEGGIMPNYTWQDSGSYASDGVANVVFMSNEYQNQASEIASTTAGPTTFLFFRVKQDITADSGVAFKYYTADNPLDGSFITMGSTKNAADVGVRTVDYVLEAPASSDKTLASLRLYNDDHDFLNESWPDGSTETTFSATVPASANRINITLTAKDANATILSGTGNTLTTTLDLTTGDNQFEYTVTAENGESQIYTVNIKRLDNTANLASLSLSNGISLSFEANTKEYTIRDVPYQTKNTTVSATPSGTATIASGTGEWAFTSSGSTPNTRVIRVNAEDCNSAYEDVPGNTCTYSEYTINLYRTAPSTDATLSNITVNSSPVDGFDANTTDYTLEPVKNNVTSLNVVATPTDPNASVSVSGDSGFIVGDNTITIQVTAEDGTTTKTYTLKVRRQSNDTRLQSLNVTSSPQGTLDPTFNAGTKTYTYTYDETVSTITVSATAVAGASVTSGNREYTIGADTSATVVVTAEDGTEDSYVINFERASSNDSSLKSLSVKNGDNEYLNNFSSTTYEYNITVPNDVATVDISAEANSENSKGITGTGTSIPVGFDSEVVREIEVTAEDDTTTTYTIRITREKSNNANLTDIKVDDVSIDNFDKDTLEYTLDPVDSDVSSLNISYTKENEYANVETLNNSLVEGQDNVVTVKVTSQDGSTTKEYKLTVRRKSSDATLTAINVTSNPQGELTPEFNPLVNEYTYYYDRTVTTINVSVEKSDSIALVTGERDYTVGTDTEAVITVTPEDGEINTYTITFEQILDDDSSLQSLVVKNGEDEVTLDPIFESDNHTYNLTVANDVEQVEIEATANSPYIQDIEGDGTFPLTPGSNTATVKVTAEDGTSTVYTLYITRQMSSTVTLSDLTIDGDTIEGFSPSKTVYDITVPSNTTSITIGATPSDITATIDPEELGEKQLTGNLTTIEFTVRAQDGSTTQKYTINVRRLSNDTSLESLSVTSDPQGILSPTFNPTTKTYTYTYDEKVTTITVNAQAVAGATVESGNDTYTVGTDTSATIVVRAEDGTTDNYTVNFERAESNDSSLQSLVVKNGEEEVELDPTFNSGTFEYNLTVPNDVEQVEIEATANSAYIQGIEGDGAFPLTPGSNTARITVTAEDGTESTYTINITRQMSSIVTLSELTIDGDPIEGFAPDKTAYDITVPYGTESITIDATPTDDTATINPDELGEKQLTSNPTTIKFTVRAQNGATQEYTINVTIEQNSDTTISDLTVLDKTPTWNDEEDRYELEIDSSILEIGPDDIEVTLPQGATITKDEQKDLVAGENTYQFTVKAEDGTEQTYTVVITREASTDNTLSTLTSSVGVLSPSFDGSRNDYTLTLPIGTESFEIEATTNFERAQITSGTGEHTMPVEDNQVRVNVISESGAANIYVIHVEYEKSDDATLADLGIEGYELTPEFTSETLEYNIEIGSDVNELTVEAIANNTNATIKYQINDEALSDSPIITLPEGEAEGTIKVVVTAEDGEATETYQITYQKIESTNNNLASLTVDGYTLNEEFNKDTLSYTLTVPNTVTSVTVRATLEDNLATLKMGTTNLSETDNYTIDNLAEGDNIVKVEVTSESGVTKTYQVTITREEAPGLNEITSSIHTITDEYITSVIPDTSLDDFKAQFDNDPTELNLYEADGITKVIDKKIATGMILKLERGGRVLDQKTIVIYGDTNGDGNVELNDAVRIVNHYLETSLLTGAYEIAADVNKNNNVGLDDAVKIVNHYLETDKLY